MYLELNTNKQVMGYSNNETSNALKTDKSVPEFTDTQILKFVDGDFVVEDSQALIDKKAEYDAQEYARNRASEYPSVQECVHAILDDTLDALQAKRALIKTKYPKGG